MFIVFRVEKSLRWIYRIFSIKRCYLRGLFRFYVIGIIRGMGGVGLSGNRDREGGVDIEEGFIVINRKILVNLLVVVFELRF